MNAVQFSTMPCPPFTEREVDNLDPPPFPAQVTLLPEDSIYWEEPEWMEEAFNVAYWRDHDSEWREIYAWRR